MLDKRICKQCPEAQFWAADTPEYHQWFCCALIDGSDDNDADTTVTLNSEVSRGCPFYLEQLMSNGEVA